MILPAPRDRFRSARYPDVVCTVNFVFRHALGLLADCRVDTDSGVTLRAQPIPVRRLVDPFWYRRVEEEVRDAV